MLVGHWPLIGNTNDYSGFNNNGTPTSITYTAGKIGQAASFNGSTSSILTPLTTQNLTRMSLSFWIYNTNAGQAGLIGTISGTRSLTVFRYPNLDDFHWSTGGSSGVDSDVLPFNTWTHVCLTYNGSLIKRYYNGVFFGQTSGTITQNTSPIYIGRNDSGYSNVLLNDVRIYNHALSDYEVKEIAKAKVLHYTFDDPNEEPTVNLLYDNGIKNWGIGSLTISPTVTTIIENSRYTISNGATAGSFRFYIPLSKLENGATYNMSYNYKLISGSSGFTMTDWCDTALTKTDINYGSYIFSSAFGTRSTYDSTFRFMDFFIPASTTVEIWDIQLEKKSHFTPFTYSYRGPEVTDSNNIFTGTNAAVYTPYFTITNQSRSVITLTAAAANTIIAMQFSGFDGNFLIGKKMVLTGRMKKNGSPFWHNSTRLNTYHAEADAQMYFNPATGDFTVLEFQSTTSPWIFHCSVTNAIGDVITIENLKIRQILPNKSLVRDSSGLNNNGFTNTTLTPRFLNGSSKLGSGSISSTNNFKGVFTTEITDGSSESFSFSIWFKTSISNSNRRPLLTKTNPQYVAAGGTDQMLVCIQDNQPQIHFWGGSDPGITQNVVDGNWHHFAGTYVYSTRLMNLYLDGVKRVTNFNTAESGMLPRSLHRWHIGMNPRPYSVYTQSFDGDIDDVRVFATALSDADMLALYNRRANFDNLGNVSINEIEEGTDSNLITDNLLLHLDPANPACFVSNDSVAYNLVTGGTVRGATGQPGTGTNTPTPSNMPVFNSINGGVFDFAGGKGMNVDDDLGQRTQVTIAMWFYKNSSSAQYFTDARNNGGGWFLSNYDGYNINYNSQLRYNYDATHNASTPNFLNKWIYMVVTSDGSGSKLYLNGQLVHSDASITENLGKNLRIGTRYTTSSQWTGYMGPIMMYGRVLSTSEVTQNYNAHKDRFIDNLYNKQFTSQGIAQFLGIDEVTGTQNTNAKQEITNNGTLLINGEFSEVD